MDACARHSASRATARGDLVIGLVVFIHHYTPTHRGFQQSNYEYVRNGTSNLFMITEPLAGWRHVEVTQRRTAVDFAGVLRWLADELLADAKKIVLVMDNLNTHTLASLYQAYEPAEARAVRGASHAQAR